MAISAKCPECDAVLPADAPRGLCPGCLTVVAVGDWFASPADSLKPEHPLLHYFGDYELLEEIGRGGMGVVYRARQVSLNRTVAVKMLLAGQFASLADLKRFRAEAETAARLNHPNIVEIYEVGEYEGQNYFSMRLVEGASLASRAVGQKPGFSARTAAVLMAKVARAVHFAHQHGVLHRDLKPGNILLDSHDEPHVTDFGLAKQIGSVSDLTSSGMVLGSPSYLSPEQAAGKVHNLTTAADLYGLGAILYFLLAGQAPFAGGTPVETLRRVVDEEPPSLRRLKPRLDPELETICLKCLEKDPRRRYGSAEALAEDLERWLRHEPILALPVGTWQRFRKWARREPRVAGLLGVSVLSLTLGVAPVFYEWRQAEASRRDALEKLRESYLAQLHAKRLTAEPGQRFQSLDILARAAAIRPGMDLRDEVVACLAMPDVRLVKAHTGPPGMVASSQPNHVRDLCAATLPGGEISIRSLGDDRELVRLPSIGSEALEFCGFSHSGRWLGVGYKDGKCRVWDLDQKTVVITAGMFSYRQGLDFREDDEQVAVVDPKGNVRVFETATGRLIR